MSIYVPQYKESMPIRVDSTIPRPKYMTITGSITAFHYNPVFEQLTLELRNTGSSFEFYSRRPLNIRRFMTWYGLDTGLVRIGVQVSITVDKRLEITGFS